MDYIILYCLLTIVSCSYATVNLSPTTTADDELIISANSSLTRADEVTTTVISPDVIQAGIETQIVARVSRDIKNLRVLVLSAENTCVAIIDLVYTLLHADRDYLIPFTLPIYTHTPYNSSLKLLLVAGRSILHSSWLAVNHPQLSMWTSQLSYQVDNIVLIWLYSYSATTLPIEGIKHTVRVENKKNKEIVAETNLTSNELGLSLLQLKINNTGDYLLTAHCELWDVVSAQTAIKIFESDWKTKQLDIVITSNGFSNETGMMPVQVSVRRIASVGINAKAHITYCLSENLLCNTTKLDIANGQGHFIPKIKAELVARGSRLNMSIVVVEQKTGLVQEHGVELDIFVDRPNIHTDNLPSRYNAGSTLTLPLMVTEEDGSPAIGECLVVKVSSLSSPLIYRRELSSNRRGELRATCSVPAQMTEDLTVEVYSCDKNAQVSKIIHRSLDQVDSVQSDQFRYRVGDVIELRAHTNTFNQSIVIQQCAGSIISLKSLTSDSMSITVTDAMYPCAIISVVDRAASAHQILSSLTFLIDSPALSLQMTKEKSTYSSTHEVRVSVVPDENSNLSISNYELITTAADIFVGVLQPMIVQGKLKQAGLKVLKSSAIRYTHNCAEATAATPGTDEPANSIIGTPILAHRPSSIATRRHISTDQQSSASHPQNNTPRSVQSTSSSHRRRHHKHGVTHESHSTVISTTMYPTEYSRHTTTQSISTNEPMFPSRNWLPDSQIYRALGLPEHWLSGRKKRAVVGKSCKTQMHFHMASLLSQCKDGQYRLQLPTHRVSEWRVRGVAISTAYGLERLKTVSLSTSMIASLAIKSPPSSLIEGEQFQLHVSIISHNLTRPIEAHVRVILSAEEAFCFKNLMLNSYPHANLTLQPSNQHTVTSFLLTSLRQGNFSVTVELWVDGRKIGQENITLEVHGRVADARFITDTTDIPNWSTLPFPRLDSANLQLKMRYNKENNIERCKGFRLTVDHSVYEREDDSTGLGGSPFDDINSLLGRKRRAIDTHVISSIPKHSLQICYRILQRSAHGSYYIDVESFPGYKTTDYPVEMSDGDHCRPQAMQSYDGGNIIMIENTVDDDSWCCFSLVLEAAIVEENVMHSQINNSASVRLHDSDRPGDFCLEFYNLHNKNPYSDHICSQRGCLCTESSLSSCQQLRTHSMRKAMLTLTQMYLGSKFVFKVKIQGKSQLHDKGLYSKLALIMESYGRTHIDTGQEMRIYYKSKRNCNLLDGNSTYLLMGNQMYINHTDLHTKSLYLDHQASVIDIDELFDRFTSSLFSCFLESLLCPTTPTAMQPPTSYYQAVNRTAESISSTITSNCKYKQNLSSKGLLHQYTQRYSLNDIVCSSDWNHVYERRRIYQSIRRHRRRKRQRRKS